MKRIYIVIAMLCAILFYGCRHPDVTGVVYDYGGGSIAFFQFTDTCLINKAILCKGSPMPWMLDLGYAYSWGEKFWIPLYPKNLKGQPLFGETGYLGTSSTFDFKIGEFYSIEDLVSSPKFIALKGGYYICYPFMALVGGTYMNVAWKDLLTMDIDTIEVYSTDPYTNGYAIHEDELVRLTKKSTMHFRGLKRDMITIDDVVETLNKLIETNTIEKHCYVASY